jgi:hypothetical protein
MRSLCFALVACILAAPAMAEYSIRPMPRPGVAAVPYMAQSVPSAYGASVMRSIRPLARPYRTAPQAFEPVQIAIPAPKKGILGTLFGKKPAVARKPELRSPRQYASGSVCNDRAIQGTAIPSIRGASAGCGIENPVRITAVDGVALSMPATLDCNTARALRTWVTKTVQPAFGRNNVVGLEVAAHYACRSRNNIRGEKISEHGRGKAIDIAGFKLANGETLTVLQDYKSRQGKPIRIAHKRACGVFGTTLGPGSDGYHEDHLHLDTARYRNGPYCK